MKKHSTLFVVILTVLFVVLMTWLFPVTYLNGEFVQAPRAEVGIMNLFTYPTYLMYNFIYIFIYVIMVGAFYSVLNKTGAYRNLLDKIVEIVNKKKGLFLALTTILFSTIISFTGHTFETLIIFPFIIGIVLLMGYDKIVASLITVGSVIVGIIGSTFSKLVNGTFNSVLNASAQNITFTDLIWFKVLLLVLGNALLILNIYLYARRNKPTKKIEESMFIPNAVSKDKKIIKWPLIVILSVMGLLIIIGTINWNDAFKITIFTKIVEKFNELTLFGYPVIPKIVGNIVPFGNWTFNEFLVLMVIAITLLKFVYHIKFDELFDSVFDGMKSYLYAASIILLSYLVLIITSNHPVFLTVLKPLLLITDGFNSLTLSIGTFISALFNSDFSFYQYSILPLTYVTSYIKDTTIYPLCGLITQSFYGIAMLIAPTSVILLYNLTTLKISYLEWLKQVWQLLLELIILVFIVSTVILFII